MAYHIDDDQVLWQRAVQLLRESYRMAATLPPEGQALADRIRDAALSVVVNVARAQGRTFSREYSRLVRGARAGVAADPDTTC